MEPIPTTSLLADMEVVEESMVPGWDPCAAARANIAKYFTYLKDVQSQTHFLNRKVRQCCDMRRSYQQGIYDSLLENDQYKFPAKNASSSSSNAEDSSSASSSLSTDITDGLGNEDTLINEINYYIYCLEQLRVRLDREVTAEHVTNIHVSIFYGNDSVEHSKRCCLEQIDQLKCELYHSLALLDTDLPHSG